MVIALIHRTGTVVAAGFALCSTAWAEEAELPLDRLDPPARLRVLMGLLALVVLALGAMALIWLGGRWARRVVRGSQLPPRHDVSQLPSDWDTPGQPEKK